MPHVRIGLTGGIATGKSMVASFLREMGEIVLDADQIYHDLMMDGTPLNSILRDRFPDAVNEEGRLDRKLLGRIVFRDPAKRAVLNRITHPAVFAAMNEEAANIGERPFLFFDVPLLFEAPEAISILDIERIWVVSLDKKKQLERLMDRDGINEEEARRILRTQWPLQEKEARASVILWNDGTPDALRRTVARVLEQERKRLRTR